MAIRQDATSVSRNMVVEFLEKTLPFSDLDRESLERVAKDVSVDFVPKDTRIMTQGETVVSHLHLIQTGGVKLYLTDEEGDANLVDYRGPGGGIGALALIRESLANLNVDTVEDTFFLKMKKEAFLSIVSANPSISQYYLKSFSDAYVSRAFGELRRQRISPKSDASLYLFTTRVGEIIRRDPLTVFQDENIQQAARLMADNLVGSLLIMDENKEIVGIVTDKDFRFKVVAEGLNYNWPVHEIMASPVITINHMDTCFNALLTMMKRQIHHLAVERDGKINGMITSHDIIIFQGNSPFSLYKEIVSEKSFEGLYMLSEQVPMVVRGLIEEGAKANNVSRMIAVLNDLILERLLTLMLDKLGPPPVDFCWLLLGSEGRKEQTFKTDQDNALLYQDPEDEHQRLLAEKYFKALAEETIAHLVECGYPRCPGDMMASNPKWRMSYSQWREFFAEIINSPEPQRVLHATIFFDFRPGYGRTDLGDRLRNEVTEMAAANEVFQRFLAQDCLVSRPPLSFFKSFIVEKDGEHKNTLDMKTRGIVPFVDFGRVMGLKHRIKETNTMDRLRLLCEAGHLSQDFASEVREAYSFLMQVRLVHQLRMMEQNQTPDNHLNPGDLTDLEKRTLKEAFSAIGDMQSLIKETFKLNM